MRRYILKRLLQLIPVLLGVTFLSFAMMRLAGSDAITELYGDKGAVSQEIIDAKRAELGLDRPFLSQYFSWLGGLLTGDMGTSYVSGRDVFGTFVSKLPATLLLTALSVAATVLLSVPLGILAAVRHDRFTDYFLRFCSFIGNALPNFFVALLLMQVFSIRWRLLPVLSEGTSLRSAVLPTLTLAIAMSAKYMRQVRAAVLEELNRQATQLIWTMNASVDNAFADFDRQRGELQQYVTREREALVEQLRATGDELVRTTLDAVPGLVGKILLYVVLALVVLIGGPFALGFWLGGVRAKARIKNEKLKMKN